MSRASNLPYVMHRQDDNSPATTGGNVFPFVAAAALNVGDVVFLSALNTVNKSTTSANYVAMIGVVVGGKQTYGDVFDSRMAAGSSTPAAVLAAGSVLAANANEEVLVQVDGIAYVYCAAAVALGAPLQVLTTSGRVDDPAAVAGQIVGTALDVGAGAASVIRMLIDHR